MTSRYYLSCSNETFADYLDLDKRYDTEDEAIEAKKEVSINKEDYDKVIASYGIYNLTNKIRNLSNLVEDRFYEELISFILDASIVVEEQEIYKIYFSEANDKFGINLEDDDEYDDEDQAIEAKNEAINNFVSTNSIKENRKIVEDAGGVFKVLKYIDDQFGSIEDFLNLKEEDKFYAQLAYNAIDELVEVM